MTELNPIPMKFLFLSMQNWETLKRDEYAPCLKSNISWQDDLRTWDDA